MSGSRFEELAKAKQQKINMLKENVSDMIRQKQLEAQLKRFDEELNQRIEEIKSEPVNSELIIEQAKAQLEAQYKANKRQKEVNIMNTENHIKDLENNLSIEKSNLNAYKEQQEDLLNRNNLLAKQEYEKILSSANNIEQTIQLRINKLKQEVAKKKSDIDIELSNITIKNEAKLESLKEIDNLYNDMKEVAVKATNL